MHRVHNNATARRTGFTLVEMLVATALTVLIMLLFASVFGTAVGTMTQQRGIANNDQKARTLQTVLRGDLEAMTYRQPSYSNVQGIVPLGPNDVVAGLVAPNQRGYFYYSENDPDLPDDVLQFTIDVMQNNARGDVVLTGRTGAVMSPVTSHLNQPEMDDGVDNGVGTSRAAEVCYFLRDGNLYRRVQLIREPQPNRNPPFDPQPRRDPASGSAGTGARAFAPPSGFVPASRDFLKE
ncbi:MAG: type II secretion system protein J, partial [Maioricimonas sp. JB049]